MTVVVAWSADEYGAAALAHGVAQAEQKHEDLVVVNVTRGDALVDRRYAADDEIALATAGVQRLKADANGLITGTGTSLGAWTAFTPTITASSGTFTTVSGSGRYTRIGKTVTIYIEIVITTAGTASALSVRLAPTVVVGAANAPPIVRSAPEDTA